MSLTGTEPVDRGTSRIYTPKIHACEHAENRLIIEWIMIKIKRQTNNKVIMNVDDAGLTVLQQVVHASCGVKTRTIIRYI